MRSGSGPRTAILGHLDGGVAAWADGRRRARIQRHAERRGARRPPRRTTIRRCRPWSSTSARPTNTPPATFRAASTSRPARSRTGSPSFRATGRSPRSAHRASGRDRGLDPRRRRLHGRCLGRQWAPGLEVGRSPGGPWRRTGSEHGGRAAALRAAIRGPGIQPSGRLGRYVRARRARTTGQRRACPEGEIVGSNERASAHAPAPARRAVRRARSRPATPPPVDHRSIGAGRDPAPWRARRGRDRRRDGPRGGDSGRARDRPACGRRRRPVRAPARGPPGRLGPAEPRRGQRGASAGPSSRRRAGSSTTTTPGSTCPKPGGDLVPIAFEGRVGAYEQVDLEPAPDSTSATASPAGSGQHGEPILVHDANERPARRVDPGHRRRRRVDARRPDALRRCRRRRDHPVEAWPRPVRRPRPAAPVDPRRPGGDCARIGAQPRPQPGAGRRASPAARRERPACREPRPSRGGEHPGPPARDRDGRR